MDLKNYMKTLPTTAEREAFAKKAGTSANYLTGVLNGRKKISTLGFTLRLIYASGGKLSITQLQPDLFKGVKGKKMRDALVSGVSTSKLEQ